MFKKNWFISLALLTFPLGAHAATFTVTTNAPAGTGSLLQAIVDANASAGPDTIAFAIGSGPQTIVPTNALPVITDTITIDGSTQPGFASAPLIEIVGTNAGGFVNGLVIATNNCVIRSLAINQFRGDAYFTGDAIQITNGTASRVEGCYLGIARDGLTKAGNSGAGVRIGNPTYYSVLVTSSNVVGGAAAAAHNLISGNGYGVYIVDSADNSVLGNTIGTDLTGTVDVGNTNSGVYVTDYFSTGNTIGGTNAAQRNLISGNGEPPYAYNADGVTISGASSNSVFGNFVGVDATGTTAIPNGRHGINILYGGANLIGGAAPGQGNLSSGNLVNGVNLGAFGESAAPYAGTPPPLPDGNIIQGNLLGTDVSGQLALPNQNDGVYVVNMQGNLIGGSLPSEGNVISGNHNNGVELACCGNANNNAVLGNLIGVTRTNSLPLGNQANGVVTYSSFNVVGGTNASDANVIAYNGGDGVQVGYYNTTGVAILRNAIYANTNFGIDLWGDGVTPNDLGDGDTGPNTLQNFPVLGFPLRYASSTVISGTLNSATNGVFRIELFDNATNDPSGYGQGQTYLGFVRVTNGASGNSSFIFTHPVALPLTHYITATATDTNSNTSEFSRARRVARPDSIDLAVTLADSVDPAPRSASFFYTLTVTNNGPTNATGVFATDTLPAGLSFVSAVSSQGSCSQAAGVVTCNLGALAAGAGAGVTITVNATNTGQVFNTVSATGNELENDPSNNSATEGTLLGVADLAVRTTDTPDPVTAGQTVTYSVTATNAGPDAATGATLYFYLDPSEILTGASVSQGSYVFTGGYLTCAFGTIPANGNALLTVTAVPTINDTNYNYASVTALEFDPDSNNNYTNQPTVVLAGPGVIQFTQPLYTVNEGGVTAAIGVQRTGGAIGTVTVNFSTANLTATAGSDYTATNGTLTFLNGESNKIFLVRITDDATPECNESLRLSLSNPTGGAVLIGQTNATLEIFDNDLTPAGLVQGVSLANTNLLTTGNAGSQSPSISDDGRYVAFNSYANNLVTTPDFNGTSDIFVRDRATGANTLASLNVSNTAAGNGYSTSPRISADGRTVVFAAGATDLTTNVNPGNTQVFARNLVTGSNSLVSVSTNGAAGNSFVGAFAVSTNGMKIAFTSYANDLAPGDNNNTADIFFRDLASNTVSLVSINSFGTGAANGVSAFSAISADGRYIAFGSRANNISPADNNTRLDIYRRDLAAGTSQLVSANGGGLAGNSYCGNDIFINGDGRFVAFESYATDLAPGANGFYQQIYLRDMVAGTNQLVSVNNFTVAANGDCTLRGLSRDGRYVLLESSANNLFTNDSNFRNDLFVRDTVANVTLLVNINLAGSAPGNDYESSSSSSLSSNGRYVSFISGATDLVVAGKQTGIVDAFVRDLQLGVTTLLSTTFGGSTGASGNTVETAVSANGIVVFRSFAADIAQLDANFSEDIFARTNGAVAPELISQAIGITGNGAAYEQRITGNGAKVAFAGYAANYVANDTNNSSDVFLHDLVTHSNVLISVNDAGNGSLPGNSDQPRPSADGRFVAFRNASGGQIGLVARASFVSSAFSQIYLRDSVSNLTTLISVNKNGVLPGNNNSQNPQLTPDGRFTVFESTASDLVSNDVNGVISDIFIRDRTGTNCELVSVNVAGTGSASSDSYAPSVSADGRYVAFESFAGNFGPTDSNNHFDVYVRDQQTGSNILCSPNLAGNNGGNNDSFNALVNANGTKVIFFSYASDLVAGDTNNGGDLFAFDLATRSLQLISRNTNGLPANGSSFDAAVSADGRYVAFYSDASDLVPNDSNGNGDVFVRDLIAGTTALVSGICAGGTSGNNFSDAPQISANGRYVTFRSFALDLAPGDYSNANGNIFRRDLLAGSTVLVSQNRTLLGGGDNNSYAGRISDNGNAISFLSSADDLIFGDANNSDDAFAWSTGVTGVDLALTKTASAGSVAQGGALTYTLAVTNYGLAAATSIVVTDALPASLTFVSTTTSQGSFSTVGNLFTANLGTLNVAAGARITINVTANTAGSVTNTATTSATQSDFNPANNTSTAIVQVTGPAAPVLSITSTNGNQLFLNWPYPSAGYSLETTTNLLPITAWAPVTNAVSNNGLINFLFLNVNPAEPARFYHLRHP